MMEALKKAISSLQLRMQQQQHVEVEESDVPEEGEEKQKKTVTLQKNGSDSGGKGGGKDNGGGGDDDGNEGRKVEVQHTSKMLGIFDRRSSWLTSDWALGSGGGGGGGGGGSSKDNDAVQLPPLRSQEVRLRRLQRRVFADRDKVPGGNEWCGGILLGNTNGSAGSSTMDSDVGQLTHDPEMNLGQKPVPHAWAQRILSGHPNICGGDLQMNCKVVRVFLTGNGCDSEYERDAFAAFCVPYLRHACRAEGLELEVLDWRWGVNQVASETLDFTTTERWQARALKSAAKTSVVGFVGDKYGPRPLPQRVPRSLFEECVKALREHDEDSIELLLEWFELDENQRPAAYVLRSVESVIKSFNPKLGLNNVGAVRWNEEVRPALSSLLRRGLTLAQLDSNNGSRERVFSNFGLGHAEVLMLSTADKHIRAALAAQETIGSRPILVIRDFFNGVATDDKFSNPFAIRQQREEQLQYSSERSLSQVTIFPHDGSFAGDKRLVDGTSMGSSANAANYSQLRDLFANPVYSDASEECETELSALSRQLSALKAVVHKESQGQVLHYEVDWEGRFDPIRSKTHARYIQSVILDITHEIERSVAMRQSFKPDIVFEEAQAHLALAYELLGKGFVGREELCELVQHTLENERAVVVHGPRGTGKTCLLAKVAVQFAGNNRGETDNDEKVVVSRFLGTTQRSETVPQLLQSLAMQIYAVYEGDARFVQQQQQQQQQQQHHHHHHQPDKEGKSEEGSTYYQPQCPSINGDYTKIVMAFWDSLGLASDKRPLHLILDGLDKLVDEKRPCTLSWLPSADCLPPNVHIVVSTTPPDDIGGGGELDLEPPTMESQSVRNKLLSALLKKGYVRQIKVGGIDKDNASAVLDGWLKRDGRALRREQHLALLAIVQRSKQPSHMMLRVLYNESQLWRSKQPVPQAVMQLAHNTSMTRRSNDCGAVLKLVFDRIEEQHGRKLTRTVLSLLLASRDGLSLMELQDLLSLDESSLGSEWAFAGLHAPPTVPRVPAALVAGLVEALDPYWSPLVRDRLGRFVLFNQDVREFAVLRYLASGVDMFSTACKLADYFGESAHTEDVVIKELNVRFGSHRFTLSQPAEVPAARGGPTGDRTTRKLIVANGNATLSEQFSSASNKSALRLQVNQRRMRELPYALIHAQRFADCLVVLTQPVFLRGMVEAGRFDELVDLLEIKALPNSLLRTALIRALGLSKSAILTDPEQLEEQLWGRLDPIFGPNRNQDDKSSNNANEDGHADVVALLCKLNALRAPKLGLHGRWSNVLEPINSPLMRTLESHMRPVSNVCGVKLRNGSRVVASACKGSVLKLWDLESGNLLANCGGHRDGVAAMAGIDLWDGRALVASATGTKILLWDAETATLHAMCERGHTQPVTSLCTVERKSDDARLLVSGSLDATVTAWEARTGSLCWTSKTQGPVIALCATPELSGTGGETCVAAAVLIKETTCHGTVTSVSSTPVVRNEKEASVIYVFTASNGGIQAKIYGHTGRINQICALAFQSEISSSNNQHTESDEDELPEQDLKQANQTKQQDVCLIASAGEDGLMLLSDAATGDVLATCAGHTGAVLALCALNVLDGCVRVCSGGEDGSVRMWNARTGRLDAIQRAGHNGAVRAMCPVQVSKNRVFVATAGDDAMVCFWDTATAELAWRGMSHTSAVSGLAVMERLNGKECVLSCSLDKTIKAWDAHSTIMAAVLVPPISPLPGTSELGSVTRSNSFSGPLLRLAGRASGIKKSKRSRSSAQILPSNQRVASDCEPTIPYSSLPASEDSTAGSCNASWVTVVAACPTYDQRVRRHAVASGSVDNVVRVFDAETGRKMFSLRGHDDAIHAIVLAGPCIISASADRTICLWSAKTGKFKARCTGHTDKVRALAALAGPELRSGGASKKQLLFASGSDDGTVKIWSFTGTLLVTCVGHTDSVHALCTVEVTTQGPATGSGTAAEISTLIVSGSADFTIKLWSCSEYRESKIVVVVCSS